MTKSYSYLFDEIEGLRVKIAKLIELQESALEQMSLIESVISMSANLFDNASVYSRE